MEICLFTLGLWSAETWKSSKNALYFYCPQVLLRGIVSNNGPTVDTKGYRCDFNHLMIIFGLGEVQYILLADGE